MARFKFCNEDLRSVVSGIDPNENDAILSIGGSGDQALALLEFGCIVYCVDINEEQIAYIKSVARKLRKKKFDEFLDVPNDDIISCRLKEKIGVDYFSLRKKYFSKKGRLEKITSNLKNLRIVEGSMNIFRFKSKVKFSKIYLSNIFTTMSNAGRYNFASFGKSMKALSCLSRAGGILYFADWGVIIRRFRDDKFNSSENKKLDLREIGLRFNDVLTAKSRSFGNFLSRSPAVLCFEN